MSDLKQNLHELHSQVDQSHAGTPSRDELEVSAGRYDQKPHWISSVIQFPFDNGTPTWIGIDENTGCPVRCHRKKDRAVSFVVAPRPFGMALVMTTHRSGVLVNSIPALSLTVLKPRDSIVIAPGIHSYITERIRPYSGAPTEQMVGQKCPYCSLGVTPTTSVVTCRCGVIYHHETEESHAEQKKEDRLNCLSSLRVCLSCGRPLTQEEYLVWDPSTLSPTRNERA